MEVIVSVTPKNIETRSEAIERLQKKQLIDDIVKSKEILVTDFSGKLDQFPQFKPYNQFSAKVQPIDSLYNTVVIKEGKYINLKPTSLFTRLTALAEREDDMEKLFEYKMTAIPMSLFKHGVMRKSDKVASHNHLITTQCEIKETSKQVLDGGALMHKVRCEKDVTNQELHEQYVDFVWSKFGQCAVVFDGYEAGSSTKDHEHCRQSVK